MHTLDHNKLFGTCPRKAEARHLTVVESFRKVFKKQFVTKGRQLVALCGPMANETGTGLQPLCDLTHMVQYGLITEDQYIGVELNEEYHKANVKAAPKTVQLIHGEISEVMGELLRQGKLSPGVVNLDTINEPTKATCLLGKVLDILNYVDGPTMVVWNILLYHKLYNRRHTWEDVSKSLQRDALCRLAIDLGKWKQATSEVFVYNGTGNRSASTMGTVIWIRKGKALCPPWD